MVNMVNIQCNIQDLNTRYTYGVKTLKYYIAEKQLRLSLGISYFIQSITITVTDYSVSYRVSDASVTLLFKEFSLF